MHFAGFGVCQQITFGCFPQGNFKPFKTLLLSSSFVMLVFIVTLPRTLVVLNRIVVKTELEIHLAKDILFQGFSVPLVGSVISV